jgi:cytochrome b561
VGAISWLDTPQRYGLVSRGFHWLMAALFAWQFAGALLFVGIGDTALTRFVGGSHMSMGFVLFATVLLRGAWGLLNFRRRPRRWSRAASLGHALIYGLMIAVPGMALLRQYGSGEAFTPFGIPVMAARANKIDWMAVPANLFHYWLGFTLLAVILGHIGMALAHKLVWKEHVLSRMA